MVKRKAAKKKEARRVQSNYTKKKASLGSNKQERIYQKISVPALAIRVLSGILAAILVAGLTLYVLDKMPARGFWTLAVIVAILAFGVIPWMRRRFTE